MTTIAFLHHLDDLFAQGCGRPGCTERHLAEGFFAPLCHRRGVQATVKLGGEADPWASLLALRCARCRLLMSAIALATPLTLRRTCTHQDALDVMYTEGTVTVSCRRCHAVQGSAEVAALGEAGI